MNNETSNPMPESAAASPEAEPVKKTRKPRAAKADGAKDAAEAKKPAAPRKRAGVKKDAAGEAKPARKRVTKPRTEEAVAVEEPVQPVAEQELQSQDQDQGHDAVDAVVAEVPVQSVAAPHGPKGRKGQNIDFADVISGDFDDEEENGSAMPAKHRLFTTPFATVYPLYVAKAEKKKRTGAEVGDKPVGEEKRKDGGRRAC